MKNTSSASSASQKPTIPTHAPVVDEGGHYAVFVKPAGMLVVAGRGLAGPTLLDVARDVYGEGIRPVHRIDRGTFGLCIVARTLYGQQTLSEAFRTHRIDKRYLALVEGTPAFKNINIDARLARIDNPDTKKGPLAQQTIDENGQRALTRVRVLAQADGFALVEAQPETGRMHQIRAHLAHVGHPLLGDWQYGAKTTYGDDGFFALCAFAVSFPDGSGNRRFVVGPIPKPMKDLLQQQNIDVDEATKSIRERFAAHQQAIPTHDKHTPQHTPQHTHKNPTESTAKAPQHAKDGRTQATATPNNKPNGKPNSKPNNKKAPTKKQLAAQALQKPAQPQKSQKQKHPKI